MKQNGAGLYLGVGFHRCVDHNRASWTGVVSPSIGVGVTKQLRLELKIRRLEE